MRACGESNLASGMIRRAGRRGWFSSAGECGRRSAARRIAPPARAHRRDARVAAHRAAACAARTRGFRPRLRRPQSPRIVRSADGQGRRGLLLNVPVK
ncbi:hypothetical protein BMAFMH_C0366 [Burkholderia mallei FMH]|nr:hypothetical protein BMAFMH_C0366 [Burkholderia mallei FMH]